MNLLTLSLAASLFVAGPTHLGDEIHPSVFWKTKKPKQVVVPATGEVVLFRTVERELSPFIEEQCKFITTDAFYGCLPEEKVRTMANNLLFTFDNRYIDEARDCDDHAWEFIVKLRRFSRDVTADVPLAPPVGFIGAKLVQDIPEMGYFLGGEVGYHAIVIVRCEGGKWLLIDPYTKKISEFTGHLYEGAMELRLVIF